MLLAIQNQKASTVSKSRSIYNCHQIKVSSCNTADHYYNSEAELGRIFIAFKQRKATLYWHIIDNATYSDSCWLQKRKCRRKSPDLAKSNPYPNTSSYAATRRANDCSPIRQPRHSHQVLAAPVQLNRYSLQQSHNNHQYLQIRQLQMRLQRLLNLRGKFHLHKSDVISLPPSRLFWSSVYTKVLA